MHRYKDMLDSMEMNITHLVAQMQYRMSDIQYPGNFPQYTQPGPNEEEEAEEEDAEDEDLRDD